LTVDGIVGKNTWSALFAGSGSTGDSVKAVQTKLGIAADGVFGTSTDTAVRAFQTSHGLPVDGVVGVNTWSTMFGSSTGGTNEKVQMEAVAAIVQNLMGAYNVNTFMANLNLGIAKTERPTEAQNNNCDFYLAIHSNATGTINYAVGTVAFYHPNSVKSKELAENLVKEINAICPYTPNRSETVINGMLAFNGQGYGEIRSPMQLGIPSALVEVNFHDNPTTANWIVNNKDAIAQAIVRANVKTFGLQLKASALPAPTGLTSPSKTNTTVNLSWNAVTGATGYNVYNGSTKLTATPITTTTYTAMGLTQNTAYSFTVKALNAGGESSASTALNVTTNVTPIVPVPDPMKPILQAQSAALQVEITALTNEIATSTTEIDTLNASIVQYNLDLDYYFNQKDALTTNFELDFGVYIHEGIYEDANYVDANALYTEAQIVSNLMAYPRVSYAMSILDLSIFTGYEIEEVNVGDVVYIIDEEANINTNGFIKETNEVLDKPKDTTAEIANFKTKFEDLFTKIATASEIINSRKEIYDRAKGLNSDRTINYDMLRKTFGSTLEVNWGTNNLVTNGKYGITIEDLNDLNKRVRINAGGIFISNDNGATWKYALSGDGMSALNIVSGMIDTKQLQIWNSDRPKFFWSEDGLYAYGDTDNKWIRFNELGIYFTLDNGVTFEAVWNWTGLMIGNKTAQQIKDAVNQTNQNVLDITAVSGRVGDAEASLIVNANAIALKVSSAGVISAINLSPETITIEAANIGLLGLVNIPNLTADKIAGLNLTLGGVNNANGVLTLKNASGATLGTMNNLGLAITALYGSETIQVGGYGTYYLGSFPPSTTSNIMGKENTVIKSLFIDSSYLITNTNLISANLIYLKSESTRWGTIRSSFKVELLDSSVAISATGDSTLSISYITCDDLYANGNVSALSFTDRTPSYKGDALAEIALISDSGNGDINHSTLPKFAQKKIKLQKTKFDKQGKEIILEGKTTPEQEEVEEDGRDLGAMISILTAGIQQLTKLVESQAIEIKTLTGLTGGTT